MPRLTESRAGLMRNQNRRTLDALSDRMYTAVAPLVIEAWRTPEPLPFARRFEGRRIRPRVGQPWGELFDCAWFRFSGAVPKACAGKHTVLLLDVSGEMCVVDAGGVPLRGLTTSRTEFWTDVGSGAKRVLELQRRGRPGTRIDVWADAGCNDLFGSLVDGGRMRQADIAVCDDALRALYYDFEVLHFLAEALPADEPRRHRVARALTDVALLLRDYTPDEVTRARAVLAAHLAVRGGDPALTVSAIGHCHIDLGWLWPIRETRRKGARSFATAIELMARYPEYRFGASQPQLYQWIKEDHPRLYAKVARRIAEGRWEAQGAMWVEADVNLSGGEALVRQILHGKRFFREEFGVDVRHLWLPDVFGYNAALPQLLARSRVPYFMTQKLSWSKINRFPHHSFVWRGIDGSEVLAHMPPEDTYNSPACPQHVLKIGRNYLDKDVSSHALMLFGIGDGGGGPGLEHLERLSRIRDLAGCHPCRQRPAAAFFEDWSKESARFARWQGELFLEYHHGTYTTHGWMKRYNRLMESRLAECEWLCGMAAALLGRPYPAETLDRIWKEFLLYQFHDILPGSSIKRVYDECFARCEELLADLDEVVASAAAALAARVDAAGCSEPVLVLNATGDERREWIRVGKNCQFVCVPPCGYAVVDAAAVCAVPGLPAPEARAIENDMLRVRFGEDGAIVSVFDKEHGREVLAPGARGNVLRVYRDRGDAWDFHPAYRETPSERMELVRTRAFAEGPVVGIEQQYVHGHSTLRQRIALCAGSRRLTFDTEGVWKTPERMLRVEFPTSIHAENATCDIQFGCIQRPAHGNTTWDVAKDEVPAQQWVDLSEPGYGAALFNDGKYGHRVKDGVLELTLLRSVVYPRQDPRVNRRTRDGFDHRYTDQRDFRFAYALYPHAGDAHAGRADAEAAALNSPLRCVPFTASGERSLPAAGSLVRTGAVNVAVSCVKAAEDGKGLVIRLYEREGRATRTSVVLGFAHGPVHACDLMENPESALASRRGVVRLVLRPFQIATLRAELPARRARSARAAGPAAKSGGARAGDG